MEKELENVLSDYTDEDFSGCAEKKNTVYAVAIDGPAGAGKSTVAKILAKRLHLVYVDTGAMYRALGLKALDLGIDPADREGVLPMLPDTVVTIGYVEGTQHIFLDGRDVTGLIRTEEVSQAASKISAIPEVREKLVELQRAIAEETSLVMDGRDIGTVVLPGAKYKFYITASAEVRAQRRYLEYEQKGKLDGRSFDDLLNEIKERDYRDMNREVAPLRPAEGAFIVDTSELGIEEVTAHVLALMGIDPETVCENE
ncbi:MAG: (d)CMP kinase [Clostridia bacterium]|nr:(d)CMP kinase [Clostridia bacterium]MBR6006943.1 (d)CMP kinase [Clostridia bacterium]